MYVYLDSRDLIDLVEGRHPIDVDRFDQILRQTSSMLVYSMHNILECCAPLACAGVASNVMRTLSRLEQLPHIYFTEARIEALELCEAAHAFLDGREYTAIGPPIVPRFDHAASAFEEPSTRRYISYSLPQIIYDLWNEDKSLFEGYPWHYKKYRYVISLNRKTHRTPKATFASTVSRDLELYRIHLPHDNLDGFPEWIYEDPTRCPALRLGYEVFHKLLRNVEYSGKHSDILDFAHISCVPYVDVATLDKTMRGYVKQVDQSIQTTYSQRIYRGLSDVETFLCRVAG